MVENSKIKLKDVIEVFPYSSRTLKRWLKEYREKGEVGLIPKSTRPKTNPRESPIYLKEKVINLRKKTKLCALKLKWKLEKERLFLVSDILIAVSLTYIINLIV